MKGKNMQKQELEFAIQSKKGVVQNIGKASIIQPAILYNGATTKWFDDSKLLKKVVAEYEEVHS